MGNRTPVTCVRDRNSDHTTTKKTCKNFEKEECEIYVLKIDS